MTYLQELNENISLTCQCCSLRKRCSLQTLKVMRVDYTFFLHFYNKPEMRDCCHMVNLANHEKL